MFEVWVVENSLGIKWQFFGGMGIKNFGIRVAKIVLRWMGLKKSKMTKIYGVWWQVLTIMSN